MRHRRPIRGLLVPVLGTVLLLALTGSIRAQSEVPDPPSAFAPLGARALPSAPTLNEVIPVAATMQPPTPVPEFDPKKDRIPPPPGPIYTEPRTQTVPIPTIPPPPRANAGVQIPGVTPVPSPVPVVPTPAPKAGRSGGNVQLSVRPRYSGDLQVQYKPLEDGLTAVVVSGGVNLQIATSGPKAATIDIEADRLVIWTRKNAQQMFNNLRTAQEDNDSAHEFYLSGHVELRTRDKMGREEVRADEMYYDVRRGVAVARKAELTIWQAKLPYPITMQMEEWIRESPERSRASSASVFSSKLPSDPGLRFDITDFTIEERKREKTRLFGLLTAYDANGQPQVQTDHIFTGNDTVVRIEGWPILYFPYLRGRVEDPLGPLETVNVNYNRIFGLQIATTWDLFEIFGMDRPEGQRWRLMADYLTRRGPAIGTDYDFSSREFFGIPAKVTGEVRLWGIHDEATDILGGDRGTMIRTSPNTSIPVIHPENRGWAFGRFNAQDMPNGYSMLGQFSFISDRNLLEQFYLNTHLNEPNQETYLYLKQQQDNWAWTVLGAVSTRGWVTETDWLPRVDGHLLGQTFLDDWLVYNARANAGFARLRPSNEPPFAYLPTDVRTDTVRVDLYQDISLPVYLGPLKIAPYLTADTAYYSNDVNGDQRGRLYGGAGLRTNLPLSRLYPDVQSELFNLNGIYHKINLTGNFFTAHSSSSLNNFPQLDRLNDDVTDQALRNIRPVLPTFYPTNAGFLTTSNLFNPQYYALRRLIDNRTETLDSIDVLQLGVRQRWQTKRGFPGNEHVVDYVTLNLGASVFPRQNRDNFGKTWGVLEGDFTWNIGDRVGLTASGWAEPVAGGPRTFDIGSFVNRPDTTSFYLGYRQIDPLQSKAVVASIVYPFSGKYAATATTVWDFGVNVTSYSFMLSRLGTDFLVGIGVNFNSTVDTFGLAFEVVPNLGRRPVGRTGMLFTPVATSNDMSVVR